MPASRPRDSESSSPQSSRIPGADEPDGLRAYHFHGVDLEIKENGRQGVGECPLCGGAGKFTVEVNTSKFRCWSCGAVGNALTFIRLLHEISTTLTLPAFIDMVMKDRKLVWPHTVTDWGVCRSIIPPHPWLVPGYDTEGKLSQLYKRTHIKGSDNKWSWRLLPTPGVWTDPGKAHHLHMAVRDFDKSRQRVDVMEGPWDGMAYWEVIQSTATNKDSNIIASPGCNVWRDEWTTLCKGKDVTLWYDSDHPRTIGGIKSTGQKFQPGYDGMQRVAKRLSGHAHSVSFLRWGPEGYDPSKPDGWDVRDALSSVPVRLDALRSLLPLIEPAPAEWFSPQHVNVNGSTNGKVPALEPESCDNWLKCKAAWKDALEWRDELSDVMVTMLAVAASTNQSGKNQLFLLVVGEPGSAKTTLCHGMLVSRHCKILSHIKSFHSGYKKEGGEDCSLVNRISGRCLITPEISALANNGNIDQLDNEARQIFDGETSNTYGNSDVDREYKALRCPWIRAGTPTILDRDQSRLGDRFLKVRIEQPDEEVKQAILLRAIRNEIRAVVESSNGTAASIIPPELRKAYALTGGYVDWLFANAEEKLQEVACNMTEDVELKCANLAMLVAEMRARPNMDPKKLETFHGKELPTRLVSQITRLAACTAVVLNKPTIDKEVMHVVRKVALDTAYGHSLNIVVWMCTRDPGSPDRTYQETGGISEKNLALWCNMSLSNMYSYLTFLRKIGVVKYDRYAHAGVSWTLTDRVYELYLNVMSS